MLSLGSTRVSPDEHVAPPHGVVFWGGIESCLKKIPTQSIRNSVLPLAEQMSTLLRHKTSTSSSVTSSTRSLTTDQAVHVVSKAVTGFVRAGKVAATDNPCIRTSMVAACDEAILAGESLCRVLTSHASTIRIGISPSTSSGTSTSSASTSSTSQNATDSGVDEDLDDELSNDIFHLTLNEAPIQASRFIQNDRIPIPSSLAPPYGHGEDGCPTQLPGMTSHSTVLPGSTSGESLLSHHDSSSFSLASTSFHGDVISQSQLATSCCSLLTSVVEVLMIADSILLEEIVQSQAEVLSCLEALWSYDDFFNFLSCFSKFGEKMVRLAHVTGSRQQDLVNEIDKARMSSLRSALEKGTPLLCTSSKIFFHFPSSRSRSIRSCSFRAIRRALQRIPKVIKSDTRWRERSVDVVAGKTQERFADDVTHDETRGIFVLLNQLQNLLHATSTSPCKYYDVTDYCGVTEISKQHSNEQLANELLDKIQASIEEFTGSPSMLHSQRFGIVSAAALLRDAVMCCAKCGHEPSYTKRTESICLFMRIARELKLSLKSVALGLCSDVTGELCNVTKARIARDVGARLVKSLNREATFADDDLERFNEVSVKAVEAVKLLSHCLEKEEQLTSVYHVTEWLSDLAEQVNHSFLLARSLANQRIANEGVAEYVGVWRSSVVKELNELRNLVDHVEVSSSRSGDFGRSHSSVNFCPAPNSSEQKAAASRLGLEIKLLASQCRIEMQQLTRNHTVACQLGQMPPLVAEIIDTTWDVYLFTKGEAPLRTTAAFFTAAQGISRLSRDIACCLALFVKNAASTDQDLKRKLIKVGDILTGLSDTLYATSRAAARGKSQVLRKVMTSLCDVKAVMEIVSKVLMEISSSMLESTPSSRASFSRQKQRSKSLTPRHRRAGREQVACQSSTMTRVEDRLAAGAEGKSLNPRRGFAARRLGRKPSLTNRGEL